MRSFSIKLEDSLLNEKFPYEIRSFPIKWEVSLLSEKFPYIYIYIYLEKLPLYNGGNHHRGSSGRVQDMLTYYKTIYSTY